jgi:predicted nucleic acid-binding protein
LAIDPGVGERTADALSSIGSSILPLDSDDVVPLAEIRARHRIRVPDAVALHTAIRGGCTLATFDTALAAAARADGVVVVGTP